MSVKSLKNKSLKKCFLLVCGCFLLTALVGGSASGQDHIWEDVDGLWSDPNSWDTGTVPGTFDSVRVDRPGRTLTFDGGSATVDFIQGPGFLEDGGGTFRMTGGTFEVDLPLSSIFFGLAGNGRFEMTGGTFIGDLIRMRVGTISSQSVENHPNSGFTMDLSGDAFMDLTSGIQFPSGADSSGGTLGANVFMSDNAHVASELRTGGPLWGGRLCLSGPIDGCIGNPDDFATDNSARIKVFWDPNPDDPNDFGDDARLIISDNAKRTFHFDVREQNRYGITRGIIQAGPGFRLTQSFDPNGGRFDIGIGGFTGETTLSVVPGTALASDLDLDGDSDGADFLRGQRQNFLSNKRPEDTTGNFLSDFAAEYGSAPLSAVSAVPEPTSIALMAMLLPLLGGRWRASSRD